MITSHQYSTVIGYTEGPISYQVSIDYRILLTGLLGIMIGEAGIFHGWVHKPRLVVWLREDLEDG